MVDLSMVFGMFTGGYPLKALDPDPKKQPPALRKASSKGQPAAQVQRAQQAQQGQTWPATGRHSQPSRSKGWTCTTWELTTNTYLWCIYKKSKHYVHIQLCAFLWKYIHIYIQVCMENWYCSHKPLGIPMIGGKIMEVLKGTNTIQTQAKVSIACYFGDTSGT